MNSSMEPLQNLENICSPNVHGFMALSNQGYSDHHQQRPHIPVVLTDNNIQSTFQSDNGLTYEPLSHHFMPPAPGPCGPMSEGESLVKSSPPAAAAFAGDHTNTFRNYNCGGRKRKRNKESEAEKPREVVHVRARRGQATDSHSLAERMRREKINEKLRCLQDLVPGCYKTMGMAVMLDVIINYVRSLQNQIEFLSMKLSAASLFNDFNSSEMEALEMMKGTEGYEERMVGVGYGGFSPFPSAWPL